MARRGNSFRSRSTRRKLEKGGAVMRTRSILRFRTIRRAARVSTGSQVTCGSGSSLLSKNLFKKFDLPAAVEPADLPEGGFAPVISLLILFLIPKGRSNVNVRWTVTSAGISLSSVGSTPTADALRAVSTSSRMPSAGKYRARLAARITPMPPTGGKPYVTIRTFMVFIGWPPQQRPP